MADVLIVAQLKIWNRTTKLNLRFCWKNTESRIETMRDNAKNSGTSTTVKHFVSGVIVNDMAENIRETERVDVQINKATYKRMPPKLKALFEKAPNPNRDEVVRLFPESKSTPFVSKNAYSTTFVQNPTEPYEGGYDDNGSAARFFKECKPDESVTSLNSEVGAKGFEANRFHYCAKESDRDVRKFHKNRHPTVKPFTLMRYLTRLVQPPSGGVIFDPFCGSGSTGVGAIANGSKFIGIDIDDESLNTASVRLADGVKNRFVTIKDKKRR